MNLIMRRLSQISYLKQGQLQLVDNMYQQITQSTNEVCIEMDLLQVGSEPVGMRCPHCHEEIMTRADYKNSSKTHLAALILGLLFWSVPLYRLMLIESIGFGNAFWFEDLFLHYRHLKRWLCCCILPYFIKRWKNVEHFCPNCRRFLGVYTRNKLF